MAKNIVIGGNTYKNVSYLHVETAEGGEATFIDADNVTSWTPAVSSTIKIGTLTSFTLDTLNVSAALSRINISIT